MCALDRVELQGSVPRGLPFRRTSTTLTVNHDPLRRGELTLFLEAEVGHSFPSGATQDRRMWLEVAGFDAAGKELFAIGTIAEGELEEPDEQRHPCMFRQYALDENGRETHDFWEVASFDDRRGKLLPFRRWLPIRLFPTSRRAFSILHLPQRRRLQRV